MLKCSHWKTVEALFTCSLHVDGNVQSNSAQFAEVLQPAKDQNHK